jgi:CelD/BcsL family acetyltransferase involved in cellulose biosynthesis
MDIRIVPSAQKHGAAVSVTCIQDEQQFEAIAGEWNALVERSGANLVFLRHEWFASAWQWLRRGAALRVLCIRRGKRLIGVCPLVFRARRYAGIRIRSLEFMSIPDTQLCDIICAPGEHETVAREFARTLFDIRKEWDVIDLRPLTAGSTAPEALPTALAEQELAVAVVPSGLSPYVRIDGPWADFYAGRSRRLRKCNNLAANRLRRTGESELRWWRADDLEAKDLDGILHTLTLVSAHSWKAQIGLSLDKPGPGAFVRALSEHARLRDWLSIWVLSLNGRPIAMEYQLIYHRQAYALRADFDEGYREISPGAFLNYRMLQTLFEADLACYHMGPGANPYKLRWTSESRPLCRVLAYSPTVRGSTMSLLALTLRPQLKRLAGMTRPSAKSRAS